MEIVKSPPEQRVLLRNVSWETYERLLEEREERRSPRFFYDRGVLEIVSPSARHDRISRIVAWLVEELAAEASLDVDNVGSATFRREDLVRGFEPDECFYFGDAARRVRGKDDVDLQGEDPPPDLVFEVDLTSSSLSKFPIYAALGVPEVWRYDGRRMAVFALSGELPAEGAWEAEGYTEVAESSIFPSLTGEVLSRFVERGASLERPAWRREVLEWAQGDRESRLS
jgi:Uma2 family endonuclease